jgi:hypothetical protein
MRNLTVVFLLLCIAAMIAELHSDPVIPSEVGEKIAQESKAVGRPLRVRVETSFTGQHLVMIFRNDQDHPIEVAVPRCAQGLQGHSTSAFFGWSSTCTNLCEHETTHYLWTRIEPGGQVERKYLLSELNKSVPGWLSKGGLIGQYRNKPMRVERTERLIIGSGCRLENCLVTGCAY